MSEIIYEQWDDDMREARYFEPPYDDTADGRAAVIAEIRPGTGVAYGKPRPEGTPLPAVCPGCVDECHCTETGRILGQPQCAFCTELESRPRR